jgi:hypothetical protein
VEVTRLLDLGLESYFLAAVPLELKLFFSELSLAQLVRFLVVKFAYPGLNSRLGMSAHIFLNLFQDLTAWHECSHFPGFILGFNGVVLLVVADISVDSETPVVTSSISRCTDTVFRICS